MQKKVIIALLVSIPILFGVFYLTVDRPSSIENDAEKIFVYSLLMIDKDITGSIQMMGEVKKRALRIESKYKIEERAELEHLVHMKWMSLDEKNLKNSFITFYQTEKEDILKNHSK